MNVESDCSEGKFVPVNMFAAYFDHKLSHLDPPYDGKIRNNFSSLSIFLIIL